MIFLYSFISASASAAKAILGAVGFVPGKPEREKVSVFGEIEREREREIEREREREGGNNRVKNCVCVRYIEREIVCEREKVCKRVTQRFLKYMALCILYY